MSVTLKYYCVERELCSHPHKMSIYHTDATNPAWQAYETPAGENTSKKIDFEEVVAKKRPFGRFRPDGTWDDEDEEAKARQAKLAAMRFIMVTSSVVAAYLLLDFYFFGLNARDKNSEDVQCASLEHFFCDESLS